MQMNEKVLTALEVLKDAAENDFEKHRIEVLIKDLTEPPVAEVIDETHQRFDGITYLKNQKSGHFTRHRGIHRDVWAYFNGEIPEGDYQIHHKDLNPSNNYISNLQLLSQADHRRLHNSLLKIEKVCPICGKTFHNPSAKVKCCSLTCGVKLRSKNQRRQNSSSDR